MMEVRVTRIGSMDLIEVSGEIDMSNVADLDEVLTRALSHHPTCCLLDLSAVSFLDSTVVHRLIRWQADAQLSSREALAVATGKDTPTVRILKLSGVIRNLPLFTTQQAAQTALLEGQRARKHRRLRWLTDADLATARTVAQTAGDDATQSLQDITDGEHRRTAADLDDART